MTLCNHAVERMQEKKKNEGGEPQRGKESPVTEAKREY